MNGSYNPLLVVLSVLVAAVASFAALDVANSVTVARGRARAAWLAGGAVAMGTGIWSMHFVGMLAFRLPGMPIAYDVPLLVLSVAVAVSASAFALLVVSRRGVAASTLAVASLAMGAAIAGMHYIGIWSMRMPARIEWDAGLVAASIAIAVAASSAALWLAFRYRADRSGRAHRIRLGGALLEGGAIAGMHYTAMAAATFLPASGAAAISDRDVLATSGLAVAVTGSTLLLLSVALTGSVVGRELARRRELAEEAERVRKEAEEARDAAQAATRRFAAVQRITDAALSHLDVRDLLHELLRRIREDLACDTATLLLLAEDGESLEVRASLGLEEEAAARRTVPLGKGISGRIAVTREPMIVPDTREEEVFSPLVRERVRSLVGVPLVVEDRAIGVLHVGSTERRDFTREDVDLLLLVAARSAHALERARLFEAALAANRAKSEFLASMSHELRTPINAVIGYAELLELGIGEEEHRRHYLARIRSSSEHLLGLINDILDLSKIESGRMLVRSDAGSLWEVTMDAIALVEPMAVEKGIELTSRCERGGDSLFRGDADRVRQILVNLLSNAVKFTDEQGRVDVECGLTRSPHPEAGLPAGGEWTYVRVRDTGVGIAPDKLDAVFQPFVQVDGSLTRSRGGTGLGLTISRQLARGMGGELTLRSEPGKGSCFTLLLPAAPAPEAAEVAPEPEPGDGASLARLGAALQPEIAEVLDAVNRRLRESLAVPGIDALPDADLEDHQSTFLVDIAQSLVALGESGRRPHLLRDSSDIQRLVSERHGAQRAKLGWREADLEREFEILGEEVEKALRRAAGNADTAALGRASEMVARLLDKAHEVSVRGHRLARAVGSRGAVP